MGTLEVLHRLEALGVTLWVDGDMVRYRPASKVPADLVPVLKAAKPSIMASLAECDDGVKRTLAARDQLCERLRHGQRWLDTTNDALCQQEHIWNTMRKHFADGLDQWCAMENQLRQLFEYQGCIHGPGQRCPDDAAVRCEWCAGGT